MEIFLLNFFPLACPSCRAKLHWNGVLAKRDFHAHAAHSCPECGAKFVYVDGQKLLELAHSEGSDIREYV